MDEQQDIMSALSGIAHREAGVETLAFRHADRLDFHDLSVGSLSRMLIAAYRLGHARASGGAADPFAGT